MMSAGELRGLRACPVYECRVERVAGHGGGRGRGPRGAGTRRADRGVMQVQRSVGVVLSLSELSGVIPEAGHVCYARGYLLKRVTHARGEKAPGGPVQRPIHARVRNGQE